VTVSDPNIDARLDKFERSGSPPENAAAVSKAIEQYYKGAPTRDRSQIVKFTMWVYSGSIALACISLFIKGFIHDESVSEDFSDLIKTAVVPIVTFVIGYYFKSGKEN
jgi:hypothetical protein